MIPAESLLFEIYLLFFNWGLVDYVSVSPLTEIIWPKSPLICLLDSPWVFRPKFIVLLPDGGLLLFELVNREGGIRTPLLFSLGCYYYGPQLCVRTAGNKEFDVYS